MPTEFVRVKNKRTGAVTKLPKRALPHLPDWRPVKGPLPDRPKPNLSSQTTRAVPAASNEQE
jgi:hypothetical protein